MTYPDIYTFVKTQEAQFSNDIEVLPNWNWNFKEHIKMSLLMKHGKFIGATNELKTKQPKRNIVYSILNLRYRAEDIDLKDVVIYADDSQKYHLSFLVKKYHDEVFVPENELDTFFDETKEEKIDYGGTLVRKGKNGPLYEPLESIAFCDQTNMLSGPIGFKLYFSPEELYEMESQGWGDKSKGATTDIDTLVSLAEEAKKQNKDGAKNQTPGKYIEVYRVQGVMPADYLPDKKDTERFVRQIQIIAYYKDKDGKDQGVTLYRAREYDNPFKVHLSGKKLLNRALAFGGVEELFDPQMWTDYSELQKKNMLDAASKIVFQTTDTGYAARNKIKDMENLEITVVEDNKRIDQIPTGSPNIQLFNQWINEWQVHGQEVGGATDALMGKTQPSGTPFRLEALITQQGQELHNYRQGKYAVFIQDIYDSWIIPDIQKKITQGTKFLATLSPDELEYVADCLVRSELNKFETERVLDTGLPPTPEEKQFMEAKIRDEFRRKGNKHFLEILKGEFSDIPLKVKVDVAGTQKNLAEVTDKLTNVFRQILQTYNPQTGTFAIFEDDRMMKIFQKILEFSGFSPIDFNYLKPKQMLQQGQQGQQGQQVQQGQQQPQPIQTPQPIPANVA